MIGRRSLIAGGLSALAAPALAAPHAQRLARAAKAQVGVTTDYDPAYVRLAYPGGDVPRTTGVCADVVIRAARDGLSLDLQKLVHEDMARAFAAYPSKRAWGLERPDASIDHRRVLNLETYWRRQAAEIWRAWKPVAGHAFPVRLEVGDLLTWRLPRGQPHVGVVTGIEPVVSVTHNIGWGVQEEPLRRFAPCRAVGVYRWPRA